MAPRSNVVQILSGLIARKSVISDAMIDQFWDFTRMEGNRETTFVRYSLPRDPYVKEHIGDAKTPR
jgi:hypothetical protein